MKKVCLVTGGAGFIGCAISNKLADYYDEVVVVDNLHPQIHPQQVRPSQLDPRVQLHIEDVTDPEAWERVLSICNPQTVIHLAAETGTGQSLTEASRHASVNVLGTTRMLDAFSRFGMKPARFVLSSSRAVYGEGAWIAEDGKRYYPGQRSEAMLAQSQWDFPGLKALPFESSTTTPNPTSVYGATKLAQEHILSAWCLSYNSSLNILRLQNVYGPGQSLSNPYTGIVSLFSQLAKSGKSIPLYEDGAMLRDFVFIDDVASAIIEAATSNKTGVLADIGCGESLSIANIAEIAASIYNSPSPHVTGQYRNGDVRHAACSLRSASEQLNWSPKVDVNTGMRRLCHWIDSINSKGDETE
ncbi:NAD-dependent epimerase/dehydratase family protein [Xanthomonas euvesicatoria]|uniref:NAD-dependent epimerase/dehydratase family protein n=1 Tax=Xanthomonas euvesicatoria TaxID=456327 RepID=UPI0024060829|nr:NAD-dependent epimerase/dehydratase family protein [Xanthomonas euvesicatoria]MCP3043459.1 GDP-mannose 4,6-dehydratase [Xanthomonas euvesicatoria pv. allii]